MSTWTAIVHSANVETGTSPYNEVAVSTVAALAGYDAYYLGVTAVHEAPEGAAAIMYASGALQSSRIARRTYNLRSYPYTYQTERHIGTNDLISLLQAPYLWLELNIASQDATYNVGVSEAYHSADYVIPVTIDSFNVEHNDDVGNKVVTINFKHRFYNV